MHTNPSLNLPIFVDRSRIETEQHCSRERFLRYHYGGMGLETTRKPLPLAVGGAVHVGLAHLLKHGALVFDLAEKATQLNGDVWGRVEDAAVAAALKDFREVTATGVELENQERMALAAMPEPPPLDMTALLEASLDGVVDVEALMQRTDEVRTRFERDYLIPEQLALVEAMVRAYARRRLRPLLEEYEVLEVEREGTWELAIGVHGGGTCQECGHNHDADSNPTIIFMSRADALLLHRRDRTLVLLSYKTAASWDDRKRRDAERDMQGLSEGIEVEMRLAQWWQELHDGRWAGERYDIIARAWGTTDAMAKYLFSLTAAPRVSAVRYEYLLKGERWEDKELSAKYGFKARHQKTPLLRAYVARSTPAKGKNAAAYSVGDRCVTWDFVNPDGSTSKLAWQNWTSEPQYGHGRTIKDWIDELDQMVMSMDPGDSTANIEPKPLGYGGTAQKMGFCVTHPLDDLFIPPITVYRNEDDLRDLIEQIEAQELRVARGVAAVHTAHDEGERRSLLNQHFQQTRRACEYPTTCGMVDICFGGDEMRLHPIESGKYTQRKPHHQPEVEAQR